MIRYKITPNLLEHFYSVEMSFTPQDKVSRLFMPKWIPGSYMVRDFSRHLFDVKSQSHDTQIRQISTNSFELTQGSLAEIKISYKVYANNKGIRTAIIGVKRSYFNPTSICLAINSAMDLAHYVELADIPPNWSVFTSLPYDGTGYTAASYQILIDNPFELGEYTSYKFTVRDIPHQIILSANFKLPEFDVDRLISDVSKICECEIDMFGGAPFDEYTFILNLDENIYTGLEHLSCTLLAAPYYSLPRLNSNANNDEYILKLLGLISHEYFHAWNVKKIHPDSFTNYDLESPQATELLWWFEGVTSYFDDLVLLQSGILSIDQYLQVILNNINTIYKSNGHLVQSLYNSSIEAWVKYYQPDDYSKNISVSYYVKGALLALIMDIELRNDGYSLTKVMQNLYKHVSAGHAVPDNVDKFIHLVVDLSDCKLSFDKIFNRVMSCESLLYIDLFNSIGLDIVPLNSYHQDSKVIFNKTTQNDLTVTHYLGCEYVKNDLGFRVNSVANNGLFAIAGIAAGDTIIAINGISCSKLELELALYTDNVNVTIIRLNSIHTINLSLQNNNGICVYNLFIKDQTKLNNFLLQS